MRGAFVIYRPDGHDCAQSGSSPVDSCLQTCKNTHKHTDQFCRHTYPNHQFPSTHRFTPSYALSLWPLGVLTHLRCCCWGPSMTLLMKLTMATAGCSGSISANRWHTFSDELPVRLATKPNTLQEWGKKREKEGWEEVKENRMCFFLYLWW